MYGAIIGDVAGSIYEYNQVKEVSEVNIKELIPNNSFYSDDTILTIAILDCILNNGNYEDYLKEYINEYKNYRPEFKPYFKTPFSPGTTKWATTTNDIGTSKGNGAMMRISPVGYLFNTEEEVIYNATMATIPSHNTKEAIDSATLVALIIFYARKGLNKEEIIEKLNIKYQYKKFKKFNLTCNETIDNCLYALFTSNNYEEAIKKVISYGGDTDTNACITASMAEALYGLDESLILTIQEKLPKQFVKKLELGYSQIKNIKNNVY